MKWCNNFEKFILWLWFWLHNADVIIYQESPRLKRKWEPAARKGEENRQDRKEIKMGHKHLSPHLFPWPLEVWRQDEADIRVGVLIDDPVRLLLVLQHVVDPIQGELLGQDEGEGDSVVEGGRLHQQVGGRGEVFV